MKKQIIMPAGGRLRIEYLDWEGDPHVATLITSKPKPPYVRVGKPAFLAALNEFYSRLGATITSVSTVEIVECEVLEPTNQLAVKEVVKAVKAA